MAVRLFVKKVHVGEDKLHVQGDMYTVVHCARCALQAQQFAWVKQRYPLLYEDMKTQIKAGGFIPVGGVWVEMVRVTSVCLFVRQL